MTISSHLIITNDNIDQIKSKYNSSITYVRCNNLKNFDLTILSNFPNLQTLNLQNNNITDVSQLPPLPKLQELNLNNNKITNITSQFPNLPKLQRTIS